jgi:hypothetical protein
MILWLEDTNVDQDALFHLTDFRILILHRALMGCFYNFPVLVHQYSAGLFANFLHHIHGAAATIVHIIIHD